jgi:hypothetical protein
LYKETRGNGTVCLLPSIVQEIGSIWKEEMLRFIWLDREIKLFSLVPKYVAPKWFNASDEIILIGFIWIRGDEIFWNVKELWLLSQWKETKRYLVCAWDEKNMISYI